MHTRPSQRHGRADHCRGIHLVLDRGESGEVYNIGSGVELTNLELTKLLLEACDGDWDLGVEYVEDRKGHDRRYSLDDSKIRSMGYAPQTPFEEGLRATVQWYRDNREWWEPLKEKAKLS
jgi:dTDP-glucose 4,6-dehydratase